MDINASKAQSKKQFDGAIPVVSTPIIQPTQMGIGVQPTQMGMGVQPPQMGMADLHPPQSSNKRPMNGHSGAKKKWRAEDMDLEEHKDLKAPRTKPTESFNLKTLNTSASYKKDIESHLKSYFHMVSNLIERASTKVTDFYYEGSMLTVSQIKDGVLQVFEMKGEADIYKFLNSLCLMRKYNISQFHIQPGIGQGAFVFVKGTMGTIYNPILHKISMSFQLVRMRKKYYILNQVFDIE